MQLIFEEHGTVEKPPSPLIRRITRALLKVIQALFAEKSDLYLDEICTWLAFEYDVITSPALSRNLKEAGLTRRVPRKLAIKRDEARRQEFENSLQNHSIGDGSEFVVLDETSKNGTYLCATLLMAARGERATLTDVLKGTSSSRYCRQQAHVNPGTREACRGRPAHIVLIQRDFDCKFVGLVLFLCCHKHISVQRHETNTVVWLKSVEHTLGNHVRCKNLSYV